MLIHAGPINREKEKQPHQSIGWAGAGIEWCCILFLVCLIYKLVALGAGVLCAIVGLGFFIRGDVRGALSGTSLLGIIYVALATVTAFQVGLEDGAYRSAQFALVLFSSFAVARHFSRLSRQQVDGFIKKVIWVSIIIFAHTVIYHILSGRYFGWKTLYDTKFTYSLLPVLLFTMEDSIKRKIGRLGWMAALLAIGILILMSGERKAYALLAALFFLSNSSAFGKMSLLLGAVVGLSAYVAVSPDDNYIVRQITSFFQDHKERKMEEFFILNDLGHRSDMVREFVNRHARDLFLDNPVIGLGATGYQDWALKTYGGMQGGFAMNVHGEINRVPVENGIIGIIVALSYMAAVTRRVLLHLKKKGGIAIASRDKLPLYILAFIVPFLATEAINTLMMEIILLTGYYMSSLSGRKRTPPLLKAGHKT